MKDMNAITVREAKESDAAAFLALCKKLDRESSNMLLEPDERTLSEEAQRERIKAGLKDERSTLLLAEDDEGRLAGFLAVKGSRLKRIKHTVYIVIGVLLSYQRQGVGTKLFEEAEKWARTLGILRMELTVRNDNEPAKGLYRKAGFVEEGIRRKALFVEGRYVDECYMSKLLS